MPKFDSLGYAPERQLHHRIVTNLYPPHKLIFYREAKYVVVTRLNDET